MTEDNSIKIPEDWPILIGVLNHSNIEAIKIPKENHILIKVKGIHKWMKIYIPSEEEYGFLRFTYDI